jgi:TrmH family RNA methyltransferase
LTLTNAEIKKLSLLKDRSERHSQKKFLIEGKRAIIEALSYGASVHYVIVSSAVDSGKIQDIQNAIEGVKIEEIPETKFRRLSSTEVSQGVVAVAGMKEFSRDDLLRQIRVGKKSVILVVDRVSDPGNLGTILRSAAWFGVDIVLIAKGSVDVYNPKVVRAAMAAIVELDIYKEVNLEEEVPLLKTHGYSIVAASQDGKAIYSDYTFPEKVALVVGSEAAGIEKKVLTLCEQSVAIPRIGKMESLNVGVATSIILAEIIRQRNQVQGQNKGG